MASAPMADVTVAVTAEATAALTEEVRVAVAPGAVAPRAGNDRRFATRSSGTLAVRTCSQSSKICTSPQEHSLNHP